MNGTPQEQPQTGRDVNAVAPPEGASPASVETLLPPDLLPPELAEQLQPEVRRQLAVILRREIIRSSAGSVYDPVREKITEKHIDTALEIMRDENANNYKWLRENKLFVLTVFGGVLFFVLFLIVYLAKADKQLLKDLLAMFSYIVGGIGIGVGLTNGAGRFFKRH